MREKSLKVDRRDDIAIRHARHRNSGICVSSEFYQPCPMFFTREASQLNLIGLYRGASAFIVSNGPSLKDIDTSLLKKPGIITYGMNNGPKTFRPNLWSCVDDPQRFLKSIWLDPSITKIVPMDNFERFIFDSNKWETLKIKVGDCPNVIGFRRNEKFLSGRWLWEDSMNFGNHKDYGGGRSVLLPVLRICFLLGFRNVYLVGADFNMSETQTYHFDEQRDPHAVKGNTDTYRKMNEDFFPALKPEFKEVKFNVFNCNPKSGLTVFPYVPFEDAIRDATSIIGDTTNERVWGMYTKPQDKGKFKNEPPEDRKPNQNVQNAPVPSAVPYPQPETQLPTVKPQKKEPKIIPNIPQMLPLQPTQQTKPTVQFIEETPQTKAKNGSSIIGNDTIGSSTLEKK